MTRQFRAGLLALALVMPCALAVPAAAAGVRSWDHGEYGRLVFDWNEPVGYRLDASPTRITIDFDRPVNASMADAVSRLDAYVADAYVGADGTAIVLTPRRPVTVDDFAFDDNRIMFDFRPAEEQEKAAPWIADATPVARAPAMPVDAPKAAAPHRTEEPKVVAREVLAKPTAAVTPTPPADVAADAPARPSPIAAPPDVGRRPVGPPRRLLVPPAQPTPAPVVAVPPASDEPEPPAAVLVPVAPAAPEPAPVVPKDVAEPPSRPAETAAPADSADAPAATTPSRVVFEPGVEAHAAVFERSGHLWVIFASARRLAPAALADQGKALGPAEIVEAEGGVALRFPMPANRSAAVTREGTRWTVALTPAVVPPAKPLTVLPEPAFPLGARLLVEAEGARGVVRLIDPEVGDVLIVAPLPDAGMGLPEEQRFAQATLLPSAQGLAVRPVDDAVLVRIDRDGVEVTSEDGLLLSSPDDRQTAASQPLPDGKRYLHILEWQGAPGDYIRLRQAHLQRIAAAPEAERPRARLDLARFHFAHGFGAEALALIDVVAADDPSLADRPDFLLLRGAARVLAADLEGAQADLSHRGLAMSPEAALWRGAAASRAGDWDAAAQAFDQAGPLLDVVPPPFLRDLLLPAAVAAVETGDLAAARDRLAVLTEATGAAADWPAVVYLGGRITEADGDRAAAAEAYEQAIASDDQLYRTRAEMALLAMRLEDDAITPAEAAARLEGLHFGWRGDGVERELLAQLGDAQWQDGRYRDALETWDRAIASFPEDPATEAIGEMRGERIAALFSSDALDALSPIAAASLYEDYKALMPTGDAGDRVVRRLAERLVDIDLLERAGDMLERLVTDRLRGTEKAEVGARLAGIRLLDGKPREALTALDRSEAAGAGDAELRFERRLLRARSLSELGRAGEALTLLAGDKGRLAQAAKLDIAWRAQDWPAAAAALDALIGAPPAAGTAIPADQAQLVLNRGIALSLAGDDAGLDRLAATFGPAMAGSPHANTFAVLTRSNAPTGALADLAAIRREVAEIDLFQDFLAGYRAAEPAPALMN